MTKERKVELRQLLSEAMQSVIIEAPEGYETYISLRNIEKMPKHFKSLTDPICHLFWTIGRIFKMTR